MYALHADARSFPTGFLFLSLFPFRTAAHPRPDVGCGGPCPHVAVICRGFLRSPAGRRRLVPYMVRFIVDCGRHVEIVAAESHARLRGFSTLHAELHLELHPPWRAACKQRRSVIAGSHLPLEGGFFFFLSFLSSRAAGPLICTRLLQYIMQPPVRCGSPALPCLTDIERTVNIAQRNGRSKDGGNGLDSRSPPSYPTSAEARKEGARKDCSCCLPASSPSRPSSSGASSGFRCASSGCTQRRTLLGGRPCAPCSLSIIALPFAKLATAPVSAREPRGEVAEPALRLAAASSSITTVVRRRGEEGLSPAPPQSDPGRVPSGARRWALVPTKPFGLVSLEEASEASLPVVELCGGSSDSRTRGRDSPGPLVRTPRRPLWLPGCLAFAGRCPYRRCLWLLGGLSPRRHHGPAIRTSQPIEHRQPRPFGGWPATGPSVRRGGGVRPWRSFHSSPGGPKGALPGRVCGLRSHRVLLPCRRRRLSKVSARVVAAVGVASLPAEENRLALWFHGILVATIT